MVEFTMKKAYSKYLFSSFKQDLTRILAIFLIVLLGVGFVVGLKSSTPDLRKSTNEYFLNSKFNDMYIVSTIGFSKSDENIFLDKVDGAKHVQAEYQMDSYFTFKNEKFEGRENIRTFKSSAVDKLELVEGNFPKSKDECVILTFDQTNKNIQIGSSIYINKEEKKVVGTVKDPFYLGTAGDATSIGDGSIDLVAYFDEQYFKNLEYSLLRIVYHDSYKYDSFEIDYQRYINEKVNLVEQIKQEMIDIRLASIKETIKEEATKAVKEELRQTLINAGMSDEEQINTIIENLVATDLVQTQIDATADEIFNEQFGNQDIKWYVLTREEMQGVKLFKEDSGKVRVISNIFPAFFFLIALLVSIASMTRIITKDRQTIGTLKSMGYRKGSILLKYIIYGALAGILGSIVGSVLGTYIIPFIISSFYKILYNIPFVNLYFHISYVAFYSLVMVGIILLTIVFIALKALRENASVLITEKAPIAGRKILLEKIPFIWKHLPFKIKSSFRNIFRFKRNLIMVLIGIGGCTGLLLTGFGLKDSMSVLGNEASSSVIKYDFVAKVSEESPEFFNEYKKTQAYYFEGDVYTKNENIPISLISCRDLPSFVEFSKGVVFDDNSIIITDQIADLLNVTVGEKIVFVLDAYTSSYQVTVTGITKNYLNNYIYFGESALKKYFPQVKKNAYLVYTGLKGDELKEFTASLRNNEKITSIISVNQATDSYLSILSNLDMIVVLIVVLSGALIAVVIYNLTDIIISERIKDIATLRVNGYYKIEAYQYVSREIFIMSILAIIIGIIFGIFFHQYAMGAIASIGINFSMKIEPLSYLYSILIALGFTILSNIIFYPKVRRIHMAEALKSNE